MLRDRLATLLPQPIARLAPLSTGVGGSITRVHFADGTTAIAKLAPGAGAPAPDLRVEGRMLDLLRAAGLPTPAVLASTPGLLVMQDIEHDARLTDAAQRHAADLLACLHTSTLPVSLIGAQSDRCSGSSTPQVAAPGDQRSSASATPTPRYGLHEDNTIGPLPQPNAWHADWPTFFRDRRLAPMLERAGRAGALTTSLATRLERLMARLSDVLPAHPPASLIHGDIWSGNVLAHQGRIAAFIDPAPYHAHAEVELAFISLFSTFGPPFFERYQQQLEAILPRTSGPSSTPSRTATLGERAAQASAGSAISPAAQTRTTAPIPAGRVLPADVFDPTAFTAARRDLYNLYPLLVHCTLFGGAYADQLDRSLRRVGL